MLRGVFCQLAESKLNACVTCCPVRPIIENKVDQVLNRVFARPLHALEVAADDAVLFRIAMGESEIAGDDFIPASRQRTGFVTLVGRG